MRDIGLDEGLLRQTFARACRSMSADVSMPMMVALGQRLTRSAVELPGPQPMSTIFFGSASGICASRSRDGRVRSSSNLRYCSALQSAIPMPLYRVRLSRRPTGRTINLRRAV
jgi:hypothetical protein